jgi:hypothetical protein
VTALLTGVSAIPLLGVLGFWVAGGNFAADTGRETAEITLTKRLPGRTELTIRILGQYSIRVRLSSQQRFVSASQLYRVAVAFPASAGDGWACRRFITTSFSG